MPQDDKHTLIKFTKELKEGTVSKNDFYQKVKPIVRKHKWFIRKGLKPQKMSNFNGLSQVPGSSKFKLNSEAKEIFDEFCENKEKKRKKC